MVWQPITEVQLTDVLNTELAGLSPADRSRFQVIAVKPVLIPCQRFKNSETEQVFVVARHDRMLICYDDVEHEFVTGTPGPDGILQNWGLGGNLMTAVCELLEN